MHVARSGRPEHHNARVNARIGADPRARTRPITLSSAVRSIADVNMLESRSDDHAPNGGGSVNVVRYGVSSRRGYETVRKDARYGMEGKSASEADFHPARPVVLCGHVDTQFGFGAG